VKKRVTVPRRYRVSRGSTYKDQLQRIVREYQDASQTWPATTHEIAAWAIRKGKWEAQPSSLIDQCAAQLARAMREEYIRDAQGRTVRAKHCARHEVNGHQLMFWFDIRTANRDQMVMAFQQRRQQVLGDCRQLKLDVESYNENRSPAEPIPMVLDFELDLEEERLARQ